jgi:hypothetical protein
MSDNAFEAVVVTREGAHEASRMGYSHAQALLADGKRVRITVDVVEDTLTARQRRFFHGPLLEQVSQQVVTDEGRRYVREVWKDYFKDRILERKPRFVMVRLPGHKRATPRRHRWSTEELGVRAYSDFIDECLAIAATDFGVEFRFQVGEREAVLYVAPRRRKDPSPQEATA